MSEPKGISRLSDGLELGVQVPFKVQPVRLNCVVKAFAIQGLRDILHIRSHYNEGSGARDAFTRRS